MGFGTIVIIDFQSSTLAACLFINYVLVNLFLRLQKEEEKKKKRRKAMTVMMLRVIMERGKWGKRRRGGG